MLSCDAMLVLVTKLSFVYVFSIRSQLNMLILLFL
uniref:Uncharacterized protein n=1 Tax=Cucumis melo TaxID=3656 RepID=A0A9I9E2J2_CUCME